MQERLPATLRVLLEISCAHPARHDVCVRETVQDESSSLDTILQPRPDNMYLSGISVSTRRFNTMINICFLCVVGSVSFRGAVPRPTALWAAEISAENTNETSPARMNLIPFVAENNESEIAPCEEMSSGGL